MEATRLKSLIQAKKTFDRYVAHISDDQDRAGAIQACGVCYELSWELMQRILESFGEQMHSPKSTFRKAAARGLIDNPEAWFDFQIQRNLTTHVYKEGVAEEVARSFYRFSVGVDSLISRIKNLIDSGDIQDM